MDAARGPQTRPRFRQPANLRKKEGAPKFERKLWRESSRQDKYHSPQILFFRPLESRPEIRSEIFEAAKEDKSRREIRSEVERSRWRTWGASRGWAGSSSAPSGNAAALLCPLPPFLSFLDWIPLLLFVYLTVRDILMRLAICCCISLNISWFRQFEPVHFGGVHHLQSHLLQVSPIPRSSPVDLVAADKLIQFGLICLLLQRLPDGVDEICLLLPRMQGPVPPERLVR